MKDAAAVLFSVFIAMKLFALMFCICYYMFPVSPPDPRRFPAGIWKPPPTKTGPPEEETPTDYYRFE
jgi:hypothetical protein